MVLADVFLCGRARSRELCSGRRTRFGFCYQVPQGCYDSEPIRSPFYESPALFRVRRSQVRVDKKATCIAIPPILEANTASPPPYHNHNRDSNHGLIDYIGIFPCCNACHPLVGSLRSLPTTIFVPGLADTTIEG